MSEESRSNRGRSNENRGRKRRYFKRKGDRAQGAEGENARATPAASAESKREARPEFRVVQHEESGAGSGSRSRNLRKRRRSRARRSDAAAQGAPSLPAARDEEYTPPADVYIYEHVVRPSSGGYEFRAEPFSKGGRTLDDYNLDLDIIFNPPPREPVGQVIARVFAEYEAADSLEAQRSGRPLPLEGDEDASAAAATGEGEPWTERNPLMAAAELAVEEATEEKEPPVE